MSDKKNIEPLPKRTCILCKKTIKRFAKWNDNKKRSVHRKCWLNFRDFNDRHFDYLFCGDRQQPANALVSIKPTKEIKETKD